MKVSEMNQRQKKSVLQHQLCGERPPRRAREHALGLSRRQRRIQIRLYTASRPRQTGEEIV